MSFVVSKLEKITEDTTFADNIFTSIFFKPFSNFNKISLKFIPNGINIFNHFRAAWFGNKVVMWSDLIGFLHTDAKCYGVSQVSQLIVFVVFGAVD